MLMYMNGYDVISDNQKQSLATSQGNAVTTNKDNGANGNQELSQMALDLALLLI